MYLLTEWDGWTGKYLAEREERDPWFVTESYFPIRPDQTQVIRVLPNDHLENFVSS